MRGVQSVIVRLGIMTEINKARGGALKWRLAKFMQGWSCLLHLAPNGWLFSQELGFDKHLLLFTWSYDLVGSVKV